MNKKSMPSVALKDKDAAADLYFEFLDKQDRGEVYNDLMHGKRIELPNFGKFKNEVQTIKKNEIEPIFEKLIKDMIKSHSSAPLLEYENQRYLPKAAALNEQDYINQTYTFDDIPNKRKYIFERVKEIYPNVTDEETNNILNSIKIELRKQKEKGASNHVTRRIYISLNEIPKYNINNKADFLNYLENPKSTVTHETTHIFQNLFKAFPDVKYVRNDNKIVYDKYVHDKGEIQSRIEQVQELLKWGFEKNEIIEFLYNRKNNDKDLWGNLVDSAEKIRKSI
jgi:hypothetical protein